MSGEQLRSLTGSTKTQLPYSKCKFIAEVLSCCQYVLVCQNVKQFSNFTHARITKFNIKAFGEDRAYLLFLDQMAVFSGRNSEFFPFQLE